MEFDLERYLAVLAQKLSDTYHGRLCFFGLQGSRARGEAVPQSDIDTVLILDRVALSDLQTYRALIASMAYADLACGFVSGANELSHWPRCDLFTFYYDTRPLIGSLEQLITPPGKAEAQDAARAGAANLYHEVCHRYLYGPVDAESLKGAYKSAFFILQALTFFKTGTYHPTKAALLEALSGPDREILQTSIDWDTDLGRQNRALAPDGYYRQLLEWSASVLKTV